MEFGAPGRARTCDLLIRSQTLYPTELRVHFGEYRCLCGNRKAGARGYEMRPKILLLIGH